jgi:hypothetical protein
MASQAYTEQVGVNLQAEGRIGDMNRLYTRMHASSSHFSISTRFYQLCAREEFPQYTLQLAERLLDRAFSRDDYNVITLPQGRMQAVQGRHETSLAAIADNSDANAFTGNHSIPVVQ